MPIAGAGAGAAKALEEILGEQMLRAQIAQREQQAQAEMALRRQQLEASIKGDEADRAQRQQDLDMQAGDRRERSNVAGTRRMLVDGIMQRTGPMTADDRRGLASLQIEAGDAPTLLQEPPTPRDPIADHEAKARIDARYRPPTSSGPRTPQWVKMPDGSITDINGIAPPGSRPFDEVADRNERRRENIHPQTLEYSKGVIRKIDDLIGREDDPATPQNEARPNRIDHSTVGMGGTIRRMAPWNNSAKDVDAELFSLSSELAISALQKMRASSQTGGAIGNVALGEMEIMKNAEAAIRSDQSPANLRRQLGIIRESEQRFLAEMEREGRQNDPGLNRGITATMPGDVDAEIAKIRAARRPQE